MNVLIVLTSHDQLGNTGKKTGFWFEELAAPYYTFLDAGAKVTLASPKGGLAPLDQLSNQQDFQTEHTRRFEADPVAMQALANTVKLSEIDANAFDTVFYPGGHGPLWDLAEDRDSIALIEAMSRAGKPVGAVCHGPAVFRHTKRADGKFLVEGKAVTAFSNSEEDLMGLTEVSPFLVEDVLKANGGRYSKAGDWQSHLVVDGLLVTGQNPASSIPVAKALLAQLA